MILIFNNGEKLSKQIEKIIFDTIDQINDDLGANIKKDDKSNIVGGDSPLDSLGVITFLMELENKVETTLKINLTLVNDDVLSNNDSPLRNVLSLKNHLEKVIKNK